MPNKKDYLVNLALLTVPFGAVFLARNLDTNNHKRQLSLSIRNVSKQISAVLCFVKDYVGFVR